MLYETYNLTVEVFNAALSASNFSSLTTGLSKLWTSEDCNMNYLIQVVRLYFSDKGIHLVQYSSRNEIHLCSDTAGSWVTIRNKFTFVKGSSTHVRC